MTKGKNKALGIAILALVIAGVAVFPSLKGTLFGGTGPTHWQKESFMEGLTAGTGRQFDVNREGILSTSRAAVFSALLSVTGSSTVETLTQGGGTRATSTDDTTATLLASDFDVENVIEFTPNVTGITLSLPATTTSGMSSIVPNSSDCRQVVIINSTSTAGASFTLAGGTGTLLRNGSTTAAVLPGGAAVLDLCRKSNTDIIAAMLNVIGN